MFEYKVPENLTWGPQPDFTFDEPVQLFTRIERNSRCCDFLQQGKAVVRNNEDDFQIIGNSKSLAAIKSQKKPRRIQYQQQQVQQNTYFRSQFDHSYQRRSKYQMSYRRYVQTKKTKFKDSLTIQPHWITQYELQRQFIEKTPMSIVEFQTLCTSGKVRYYNEVLDKVRPTAEKQIPQVFEDVVTSSTQVDPYLSKLIRQSNGREKFPTIYTTDKLLMAILTMKYSVYPWDLMVLKKGNQLIFDKADENKDKLTYLEMQTINENYSGDMPEDEKTVQNNCEESTTALGNLQLFSIQNGQENEDLSGERKDDAQYSNDMAFKYVKCILKERIESKSKAEEPKAGDERINVIVRTTIEACNSHGDPILVKGLNENETIVNWRKQIQTSAGQLTSQLYSGNTNNIAKWLCQAQIADVNEIKIGFIARQTLKDASKHSLLMMETYSFKDMQQIISFRQQECWYKGGMQNLRYVAEYLSKLEDGQYYLVKQAYKLSIRVFKEEEEEIPIEDKDDF